MILFGLCIGMSQMVMAAETTQVKRVKVSEEVFPDPIIREQLLRKDRDVNEDGYLDEAEIKNITVLYLEKNAIQEEEEPYWPNMSMDDRANRHCIVNLKGVENLQYLKKITIAAGYYKGYESKILNFKCLYTLPRLTIMNIREDLKTFKAYKFKNLKYLEISNCTIDKIKLGKKSKLKEISMKYAVINKTLDISRLEKLEIFKCEDSALAELKMSKRNKKLKKIVLAAASSEDKSKCKIKALDFSNLKKLEISNWSKLGTIKLKNNDKLKKIKLSNCRKLKRVEIINCKFANKIAKKIGKKYCVMK